MFKKKNSKKKDKNSEKNNQMFKKKQEDLQVKSITSFDKAKIVYLLKKSKKNQNSKSQKTILFLHGAWGNKSVWKSWIPFFEEYNLIIPDLRCHGASDHTKFTIRATTRDLEILLQQEKAQDLIVVGNSYGSVVGYDLYQYISQKRYNSKKSLKIKKMVLFSISSFPFLRPYYTLMFLTNIFSKFFSLLPKKKNEIVDYTTLRHVPKHKVWIYDKKGMQYQDMAHAVRILLRYMIDLKIITVPTMIIEGKHDPFINTKKIQKQIKNKKNITLEVLSGNHRIMYKESDQMIKKVKKFVEA